MRILEIETKLENISSKEEFEFCLDSLLLQEAWIDDASSEDLSQLVSQLRIAGALEVVCNPVQMKKNRQGVNIKVLVDLTNAEKLRSIWFSKSTTIGIRESQVKRWSLPRRMGYCKTSYGNIRVKQVKRPDGKITAKPEHEDLVRVSEETGKSLDEVRIELLLSIDNFTADKDWFC